MGIPIKLEVFEGPLDLLMHLIEKNKIDIYDIPIVEITDQYMEYIHAMEREDLGIMSEFMVMAATLLDIKCRMLLPKEVNEDGEEETNSFRRRRKNDEDDWPPRDRDFDASPRSREDADDAYMAAVRDALRSGRELEESPDAKPVKKKLGFCRHRLFGRGKIVEEIPPDKYRVNFPRLGLKIILADYLTLE